MVCNVYLIGVLTLVLWRGCQCSATTVMCTSKVLMTLTSDSATVLAKLNPRWRAMASWFVTIRYTATAVPPTMTGHTMTSPNACAKRSNAQSKDTRGILQIPWLMCNKQWSGKYACICISLAFSKIEVILVALEMYASAS